MIDLHSHLLFGIDDGVINLEESIAMISSAYNNGYKKLIITPHYIEDSIYSSTVTANKEIKSIIEKELSKQNINIELFLGNEVLFSNNTNELLEDNKITTLNNSKYLLIELYQDLKSEILIDKIDSLIRGGIIPIIAHPERYDFLEIEDIKNIVLHGALLQINTGSILGKYGKTAKKRVVSLLKLKIVHFAASDNHRIDNFSYTEKAKKKIRKIISDDVEHLFELNPEKVLNNYDI